MKIVRIALGTAFLWFCAEYIVLPCYGMSDVVDSEKIVKEINEALEDKKIESFKINPVDREKINNIHNQVALLSEIKAHILTKILYHKGVKYENRDKFVYNANTGVFVRKKE